MIIDTDKCEWVKYLVTGPYGMLKVGDEVNVKLVQYDKDSKKALIYHPPCEDASDACFSICKLREDDLWVDVDQESYVNVT